MAPLAHTLALLAMTVATAAIEVVPLDLAKNSFDDQYQGCREEMMAALPALNRSEQQQNKNFAQVWAKATVKWHEILSIGSYLSSRQAIALIAYTMDDELYEEFNAAVREAGRSHQEYRDKFHFKTLHFLLTEAMEKLRDIQGQQLRSVFRGLRNVQFEAEPGDTVRFGQFMLTSFQRGYNPFGMHTVFWVETNHGVDIRDFSSNPSEKQVLISPFETFKVIFVSQQQGVSHIYLNSTGTHSNHNCEWLRGGSIPRDPPLLGGLLLATMAMAVATRSL